MCVHGAAGMAALIVSGVCFVCVHGGAGMAALIVFWSVFCVCAWRCWHGCTHSFLECVLCVCMELLAWLHS